MTPYENFIKEFEEIRPHQIKTLENYRGYDNLPEKEKLEFDNAQKALLDLLKQI
ncbi:MAG: hypothetical protein J6X45_05580 [Lachnospiraceae bacterium]|nr:hypothetical protein [Lachnospiraceae bacterium]